MRLPIDTVAVRFVTAGAAEPVIVIQRSSHTHSLQPLMGSSTGSAMIFGELCQVPLMTS